MRGPLRSPQHLQAPVHGGGLDGGHDVLVERVALAKHRVQGDLAQLAAHGGLQCWGEGTGHVCAMCQSLAQLAWVQASRGGREDMQLTCASCVTAYSAFSTP